jgi:hypothetical protein
MTIEAGLNPHQCSGSVRSPSARSDVGTPPHYIVKVRIVCTCVIGWVLREEPDQLVFGMRLDIIAYLFD